VHDGARLFPHTVENLENLRLWASLASETWASSSRTKVDKKVSTTSDSWSDEYSYSALPWEHAETCGKGSV
jgi:hypothetical protein